MESSGRLRLSLEDLRPATLDGIVEQAGAIARLERISRAVIAGRLLPPNLLFHGPPGVGKTTAARAYARAILGEAWEFSFHQLDASDDRSLEVLRGRIIPQTRTAPIRNAPLRIFFFDEADALTEEEQGALRPALEGGDGTTVMILACNRLNLIAEPIQSRCTVLEFGPVSESGIRRILADAVPKLGIQLEDATLQSVVTRSNHSPREAIRLLLEEAAFVSLESTEPT
jgi:replication factor C small subunit